MNYIFVTNGLSRSGGTERIVAMTASGLTSAGADVQILVPGMMDSRYEIPADCKIITAGLGELPQGVLSRLHWSLAYLLFIARYLSGHPGSILIGIVFNLNVLICLLGNAYGCYAVGWEHIHYHYHGRLRRYFRAVLYTRLNRIVVLTERDKKLYPRWLRQKLRVIPNPAPRWDIIDMGAIDRERIILGVGRLVPQKGFDRLLKIYADFVQTCPGWNLVIIGAGTMERQLKEQCEQLKLTDKAMFLGELPPDEIIKHYQSASIFTLTSRFEAFPVVLLEAMTCGLPIIAFDCVTGPREILTHGVDGFLIDENKNDAFVDALVRLANSQQLRNEMGYKGQMNVKRFELSAIIQDWLCIKS